MVKKRLAKLTNTKKVARKKKQIIVLVCTIDSAWRRSLFSRIRKWTDQCLTFTVLCVFVFKLCCVCANTLLGLLGLATKRGVGYLVCR